jgi:hypothetical protein
MGEGSSAIYHQTNDIAPAVTSMAGIEIVSMGDYYPLGGHFPNKLSRDPS